MVGQDDDDMLEPLWSSKVPDMYKDTIVKRFKEMNHNIWTIWKGIDVNQKSFLFYGY
jgi:hypothetical protein